MSALPPMYACVAPPICRHGARTESSGICFFFRAEKKQATAPSSHELKRGRSKGGRSQSKVQKQLQKKLGKENRHTELEVPRLRIRYGSVVHRSTPATCAVAKLNTAYAEAEECVQQDAMATFTVGQTSCLSCSCLVCFVRKRVV